MPYAVTCRSCGARFSVADELVHKKLTGKVLALRCKRCHEPIRINASEPPGRRSSRPPAPAARSPLPQGPARPKPRPPLKTRATPSSTAIGHHRRKPPPRSAARKPQNLQAHEKEGVNHDLFDAGPASGRNYVDLSDMAHSEPPGTDNVSRGVNSSTPPLFDLAQAEHPDLSRFADDVDFLLGLTGSPGTAATLGSPSLADLARKAPSEPPASRAKSSPAPDGSTPTPRAAGSTRSASPLAQPEKSNKQGRGLGIALGLAAAMAAALAFGLATQRPGSNSTESPRAALPTIREPEPKPAPNEPAAGELAMAATSVEPPLPAQPAAASASAVDVAHTTRSAKANPNAKAASAEAAPASRAQPAAPAPAAKAPLPPKPEPAVAGTAFDRAAAVSALASAAAQASTCRKDGDPSGVANVTVTFAPSGRVTTANLSGPPFAGTATGGCIASTVRRAKIPAFDGEMVTVSKTIVVQ